MRVAMKWIRLRQLRKMNYHSPSTTYRVQKFQWTPVTPSRWARESILTRWRTVFVSSSRRVSSIPRSHLHFLFKKNLMIIWFKMYSRLNQSPKRRASANHSWQNTRSSSSKFASTGTKSSSDAHERRSAMTAGKTWLNRDFAIRAALLRKRRWKSWILSKFTIQMCDISQKWSLCLASASSTTGISRASRLTATRVDICHPYSDPVYLPKHKLPPTWPLNEKISKWALI